MDEPSLTITRQAELLQINRTSVYRNSDVKQESPQNLELMNKIDEIHTADPTYGYRMVTAVLEKKGANFNPKRIRRLMRKMGIYPIYPKPNLSKRLHVQYCRPYLLRNVAIERPDQVWGVDITYIRMTGGFMYLFVIIDWYSRCIVDFELSNTLEKTFVMECLARALNKGKPEIINSDQGSHFTNQDYLGLLNEKGVKISMDGKGRATDNARTERFFRTLKYDCIYIQEFSSPRDLRQALNAYVQKYNCQRPCQAIDYDYPAVKYGQTQVPKAA